MKKRRFGTAVLAASLFSLNWCADAGATWYQYKSNINLLIPETDTFIGRSSVYVADSFTVDNVMVKLDIEHKWVGDVTIFFSNPNGWWISLVGYPIDYTNTLSNRPIYGANYGMEFVAGAGYNFTDKATAGLPPEPINPLNQAAWQIPGGDYLPEDIFGLNFSFMFKGLNAQGYWNLDIFDNTVGDGGRLISWQLDFNKDNLYFPCIKDNDSIGWENYLSVQAKEAVPMDVTIRVYNMGGTLVGKYVYSNAGDANAPPIPPNARVAQRPSWIAGTMTSPVPVEGSVIVETSVSAIGSANNISNSYNGFSIYEAAKVRQVHNFPKAFDGPSNYQVYMLVQNIYDKDINVSVKLFGKTATDPGHGAMKTFTIPAYGTLKVRPSEIAPIDPGTGTYINFNGSVVVYSDLSIPTDGLGPPIPAMSRFEAGTYALAIYESTVPQPSLQFPNLRDGKFGTTLDYQNFLTVVNPSTTASAIVNLYLYDYSGVLKGSSLNVVIAPTAKLTTRPGWITGTMAVPLDFEGSCVVTSNIPVVGQTNTIYPGFNTYKCDAFDLLESSIPNSSLLFPKAFDNILGSGLGATKLTDNYIYVQNPESIPKAIKIEQFNNDGTPNGVNSLTINPFATHVYRPKDLVTDGADTFRGSIKVTETTGKNITGALKYELHNGATATTKIDNTCLYRSMGQ